MKWRSSRFIFLLGVLSLTLAVSRGQTNTIIVPKEAKTKFGTTSDDPFFFTEGYEEQVYAKSEFAELPADIINITEIAFRVDERFTRLDAHKPRVTLRMNTFSGSMEEVVQRKSGLQDPVTTVFSGVNVHFNGTTGQPEAIDVKFPLQTPFVYDRRLGQLVLGILASGQYTGDAASMDSHGILDEHGGVIYDRGAYIYVEPFGFRQVKPVIIITKFTYTILSAKFDAIRSFTNYVQIDYSVTGGPNVVQLESSAEASGTYVPELNALVIIVSPGKFRATVAVSTRNRFFRIRLG